MKKSSNRFLQYSITTMLAICIFASTFTIQALASAGGNKVGIGFTSSSGGNTGGGGGTGTSTGTTEVPSSTGEATTESSEQQTIEESTSDGSTGSTKDPVEPNPNPNVPSTTDKGHGGTGKPGSRPTTGDQQSLVQLAFVMILTVGLGILLIFLLKKRKKE